MRPVTLTGAEARHIALAAQGFASAPPAKPGLSHIRALAKRLHAFQLDTVNVLVRAHYLPAFSRLGPYPAEALNRLVNVRHELIELDAHQASLVPVDLEPLFRPWRGRRYGSWANWRRRFELKRPGYLDAVERAAVEAGPIRVADLPDPGRREKPKAVELAVRRRDGRPYAESSILWWRSSDGKEALEGLVVEGRLAPAGRGVGFERLYNLAERVIPPSVLNTPTPSEEDARRELVRLSAQALGVATVGDLANYFTLKVAEARKAVRELVEAGALLPARVEGWREPAFLDLKAKVPKALDARALLSPFDSLTWSRGRTRRLFGFDFSFEIYVSAPKRRYGYYVLPFLLGNALVARVDLKADRKNSRLLVQSAFLEPGGNPRHVVPSLASELRQTAEWLGLEAIKVGRRGNLAPTLARALLRS